MERWQRRCKLTEEQIEKQEVPSWALSMTDNWRRRLDLPKDLFTEWEIFSTIESLEVYLFDEEDQVEVMKDALGVI